MNYVFWVNEAKILDTKPFTCGRHYSHGILVGICGKLREVNDTKYKYIYILVYAKYTRICKGFKEVETNVQSCDFKQIPAREVRLLWIKIQ